jgi:thiol:disulfide interchange protein
MNKASRRLAGAFLFLLVLLALAVIAIPMWLIQPFSPQTPEGLSLSYALRRWAPLGTLLALAAGLGVTVWLWRGGRWWSRTACALVLVVLAAAAWASRQNVFEKMFAPLEGARFAAAGEADWVAEADPVMAVERNGEAVAYPVRQLAYHHIVQDVIGGEPVVATY